MALQREPAPGGSSHTDPVIHAAVLGPYQTNCYVVAAPGDKECWIIDAGFDPEPLIGHIRSEGLKPSRLLLTHAHADHIAGIAAVQSALGPLPVFIHAAELEWPADPERNLSGLLGAPVSMPTPDGTLTDGEVLELGQTSWTVLHTPGHSPGGITLHCAAAAIALVGDTLFADSIGRSDFPGSDEATLVDSIRRVLYALPERTMVLPGHGPPTTIGRERQSNPFVRPVA